MHVNDMCMGVKLQSLCDHTAIQLITLNQEKVKLLKTNDASEIPEPLKCTVFFKYGSDGSGSLAMYSLLIHDEISKDNDETHLIATFICPMGYQLDDTNTTLAKSSSFLAHIL